MEGSSIVDCIRSTITEALGLVQGIGGGSSSREKDEVVFAVCCIDRQILF